MSEPASMDELNARVLENHYITGYGMDVVTHSPCPFCGAKDWQEWPIISTEEAMAESSTCSECGRSARTVFTREFGSIEAELVQTGGDDPPEWHEPKMRRVDA